MRTWCVFFRQQPDVNKQILCHGGGLWPRCRDFVLCSKIPYTIPPYIMPRWAA